MNTNIIPKKTDIFPVTPQLSLDARAGMKQQRPCVLWFTGLSGAGKSTIANQLETDLFRIGLHTYLLDGDNIRNSLCSDLGFSLADRHENVRRVAEVSRLMADAGLVVLVSLISPLRIQRELARNLIGPELYFEIHVDTPLSVAEARDPKGLYRKARAGALVGLTGIDSPYEAPEHPSVHLQTETMTPRDAANEVLAFLRNQGVIDSSKQC